MKMDIKGTFLSVDFFMIPTLPRAIMCSVCMVHYC